jgi:chromosome segregation ATPase
VCIRCIDGTNPLDNSHYAQMQRAEDQHRLEQLRSQVASFSIRLQEKEQEVNREKAKVAALHLEVLKAQVAADHDLQLKINDSVVHLRSQLEQAERELEFYKDGTEELRSNLSKSKNSNLALIAFLYQILVDGVYPESNWDELKAQ